MKHLLGIFAFFSIFPTSVNAATWGSGTWGEALWLSISVNVPFPVAATGIIFLLLTLIGSRVLTKKLSVAPVMLLGALAMFSSVENTHAQFSIPNQFTNGTTIDAAEMNENFAAIVDAINQLANGTGITSGAGTYGVVGIIVTSDHNTYGLGGGSHPLHEWGTSNSSGTGTIVVDGNGNCSGSIAVDGMNIRLAYDYDLSPPFSATSETGPGGGTLTVPCTYTSQRGVIIGEFRVDDTAGKSRGIFVGTQISP